MAILSERNNSPQLQERRGAKTRPWSKAGHHLSLGWVHENFKPWIEGIHWCYCSQGHSRAVFQGFRQTACLLLITCIIDNFKTIAGTSKRIIQRPLEKWTKDWIKNQKHLFFCVLSHWTNIDRLGYISDCWNLTHNSWYLDPYLYCDGNSLDPSRVLYPMMSRPCTPWYHCASCYAFWYFAQNYK